MVGWRESISTPGQDRSLAGAGRSCRLATPGPSALGIEDSYIEGVPARLEVPELPDITVYVEALQRRAVGSILRAVRLRSAFLLRSVEPSLEGFAGRRLTGLRTIGKRIVFCFADGDPLYLVLHLMIAGRMGWKDTPGAAIPGGKRGLAAFDFDSGSLLLTEAAPKKRASLMAVRGDDALRTLDPGGIDLFTADAGTFAARLLSANHTLKRALTDPRLVAGIGGAYADEILHRARLSPVQLTRRLDETELHRLFLAGRDVLSEWIHRLRAETGDGWPVVTAFREDMAVHGRFGLPCPVCGSPVQRILYADRETNYCPVCQTGGRILADRALSRLLKADWPRTVEELEEAHMTAGRTFRKGGPQPFLPPSAARTTPLPGPDPDDGPRPSR